MDTNTTIKTNIKYITQCSDYKAGNAGHNLIYYTQSVRKKIKQHCEKKKSKKTLFFVYFRAFRGLII